MSRDSFSAGKRKSVRRKTLLIPTRPGQRATFQRCRALSVASTAKALDKFGGTFLQASADRVGQTKRRHYAHAFQ
jgi:hypothetical protein